jgi:hypothetical protein
LRTDLSADLHWIGIISANHSIGLIVTELVINALKHAFIDDRANGVING